MCFFPVRQEAFYNILEPYFVMEESIPFCAAQVMFNDEFFIKLLELM